MTTDAGLNRNYAARRTVKTTINVRAVTRVLRHPLALLGAIIFLQAPIAGAQSTISFPEMPMDSRTARVQNLAEEVYSRGNFERAYFIYRNELTPIGDKYGQYMVGYLHLTGKGVERDIVAASAWYRLAAERGTKEFVQVRDKLYSELDPQQRADSDQQFVQLRKQYGDLVLLARAVADDYEILRTRTGSRLGSDSPGLMVMVPDGTARIGYYAQIERRMRARLAYIARHVDIQISEIDAKDFDASRIEEQVVAVIDRLE